MHGIEQKYTQSYGQKLEREGHLKYVGEGGKTVLK
jgi:hypothetical protein